MAGAPGPTATGSRKDQLAQRRWGEAACAAVLALGLCLWPATPDARARPHSPVAPSPTGESGALLKTDPRLRVTVELHEPDRPVGELLESLGRRLRVRLRASRETGDDRITLLLKPLPAAEALALLARHLEFEWTAREGGYELVQPASLQRRAASLRDADLAGQVVGLRRLAARLARFAGMARERLSARLAEVERQLKREDLEPAVRAGLHEEQADIARVVSYEGGSAAPAVLESLTPLQSRELLATGRVRLSSVDGTLPERATALVHSAALASREDGPAPAGGEAPLASWSPVEATADLRLREAGDPGPLQRGDRRIGLRIRLASVRASGTRRRTLPLQWFLDVPAPPQTATETVTADPRLLQEVALSLPRPLPPAPVLAALTTSSRSWPARHTLGEVAEALHRRTGLEVVADSFCRARPEPALAAGRGPLVRLLDRLAVSLNYRWRQEGDRLYLRSRICHWDRL